MAREKMAETEREYVFSQRDDLILLLSTMYPSHMYHDTQSGFEWDKVCCIHLDTGMVQFHLSDNTAKMFDELGHMGWRGNDWDGSDSDERSRRIRRQAEREVTI